MIEGIFQGPKHGPNNLIVLFPVIMNPQTRIILSHLVESLP